MKKFPRKELKEVLTSWYKRKSGSPLRQKKKGTVFDIQPEISSIETLEVFLEVKHLFDFVLKKKGNLIKPGGYRNCNEFVGHMMSSLKKRFDEMNRSDAKVAPRTKRGVKAHAS